MKRKKISRYPSRYDSKLEYELHSTVFKNLVHHPKEKIYYEIPHSYEPDFYAEIFCEQGCKQIFIEAKGRFRDRKEAAKYVHIKEALKENQELIFVFQDSRKPMPNAKKRKDGTKQTHGEWACKNNFRFFCLKKGVPERWIEALK